LYLLGKVTEKFEKLSLTDMEKNEGGERLWLKPKEALEKMNNLDKQIYDYEDSIKNINKELEEIEKDLKTKEKELQMISGGANKWLTLGIIGGLIAFFSGFLDGFVRPIACNK